MNNSMLDELDVNWEQLTKTLNSFYNATFTPFAVKGMVQRSFDKTYSDVVLKSLRDHFRGLGLTEPQVAEATRGALALPQARSLQIDAVQKTADALGDGLATKSTRQNVVRQSNGYKPTKKRDMFGRNREY